MVNFVHNVTALAGAFTLTRIFDFQGHLVTLSQNQVFNGAPIVSFPPTSGALNQEWFIDPLPANDGTFIMQNWLGNFFSAADAGQGNGDHSPAVAAPSSNVGLATVFKMQTVGSGPQVNFIQALGSDTYALTAWSNPDPATRTDPTTPITMERLMVPNSFMQTFTIQLALKAAFFSALKTNISKWEPARSAGERLFEFKISVGLDTKNYLKDWPASTNGSKPFVCLVMGAKEFVFYREGKQFFLQSNTGQLQSGGSSLFPLQIAVRLLSGDDGKLP
ncbi:hypothetical protein B0H19DRAFT_1079711 [Mycena capillaripes]|nr:hypothetical protein B0H19DRAFT_1079711 [Mycena capillaripes]